jgi:hypothetical protein
VASRSAEIFERSKIEQKRELIAFVFSNLRLRGKKLEFSLRSPFDLMVNRADYSSWLAFLNTVRTERFGQVLALRQMRTSKHDRYLSRSAQVIHWIVTAFTHCPGARRCSVIVCAGSPGTAGPPSAAGLFSAFLCHATLGMVSLWPTNSGLSPFVHGAARLLTRSG